MSSDPQSTPANDDKNKPKRRKHRDWSGATVGAALGLAGLFAARLGQLWIGFDIFAQFWIQFVFLALACGLGLASPRYKSLVAMVLFSAMIAGYSIWPYYVSAQPPNPATLKSGEKQLKITSFNTLYWNTDTTAIAREMARLDSDVVTLIEFGPNKSAALDLLKAQYPYQETCWAVFDCDFAVLSKFPLHDTSAQAYWEGSPYMITKMGPEFGNLNIASTHTNRFPHQRAQLRQVQALVKVMETVQGPVVLTGDFNATPFSRITQVVADGTGFERLTYLPSWSATYGMPQLAIDHVFASPGIRALDQQRIGEYAGSDHFPITITLGIPTQ